jgi:hypothetical protein
LRFETNGPRRGRFCSVCLAWCCSSASNASCVYSLIKLAFPEGFVNYITGIEWPCEVWLAEIVEIGGARVRS